MRIVSTLILFVSFSFGALFNYEVFLDTHSESATARLRTEFIKSFLFESKPGSSKPTFIVKDKVSIFAVGSLSPINIGNGTIINNTLIGDGYSYRLKTLPYEWGLIKSESLSAYKLRNRDLFSIELIDFHNGVKGSQLSFKSDIFKSNTWMSYGTYQINGSTYVPYGSIRYKKAYSGPVMNMEIGFGFQQFLGGTKSTFTLPSRRFSSETDGALYLAQASSGSSVVSGELGFTFVSSYWTIYSLSRYVSTDRLYEDHKVGIINNFLHNTIIDLSYRVRQFDEYSTLIKNEEAIVFKVQIQGFI